MYDLLIIGGGPAGLTAAIYAARSNLKVLILTESVGGQVSVSYRVENYPGFVSISGMDLAARFEEHVKSQGVEIRLEPVENILQNTSAQVFKAFTPSGKYGGKAVILAMGGEREKLDVPGEAEFIGRGVSYCATCDGFFFKGLDVAVVGGGSAALSSVLLLANLARKVYLIHRRKEFRGEPIRVTQIKALKNVELVLDSVVEEIRGDTAVKSILVKNKVTREKREIMLSGVFAEIGAKPASMLAQRLGVKLDNNGYIIVDSGQRTNIEGVFAAGDITTGSNFFGQIITAASEGAIAANSAYEYLKSK